MHTLVIPSFNRQHYFSKLFNYYASWGINIILVDSSDKPYIGAIPKFVNYKHTPGLNFAHKVAITLESIDTDLITLGADDDYYIQEKLIESVDFLRKNKKYVAYIGNNLGYMEFRGSFKVIRGEDSPQSSSRDLNLLADLNPTTRVEKYLSKFRPIVWSTCKRECLIRFFNALKSVDEKLYSHTGNPGVFEIPHAIFLCSQGGIYVDDEPWCMREISWKNVPYKCPSAWPIFSKEFEIARSIFKDIIDESLFDVGLYAYFNFVNATRTHYLQEFSKLPIYKRVVRKMSDRSALLKKILYMRRIIITKITPFDLLISKVKN